MYEVVEIRKYINVLYKYAAINRSMPFNVNLSIRNFPVLRFHSRADDRAASSSIKTGARVSFFGAAKHSRMDGQAVRLTD